MKTPEQIYNKYKSFLSAVSKDEVTNIIKYIQEEAYNKALKDTTERIAHIEFESASIDVNEKAKEYTENKKYPLEIENLNASVDEFHLRNETYESYLSGHNQAVSDQHSKMTFLELELDIKNQDNAALLKQLTQYKEALRELVVTIEAYHTGMENLCPLYISRPKIINEAKQLLNNE